jgi:hypothetical protein
VEFLGGRNLAALELARDSNFGAIGYLAYRHPSESWDPVKIPCEVHLTSCFRVLRTHAGLDSSLTSPLAVEKRLAGMTDFETVVPMQIYSGQQWAQAGIQ